MAKILIYLRKALKLGMPVLLITVFAISSAATQNVEDAVAESFAQSSATDVCQAVAGKAQRTLWSSVRESADELFCRKPWVTRRPDELAACGLSSIGIKFGNKVKNKWNAFFDKAGAEWATWGARGISVDWEEGVIRGGIRRTYFGPALAYNNSTVEVVKEGGQAEAHITVCELDYDSNVISARQQGYPNGQGNENEPRKFVFQNTDNRILGVVVDTPFSINNFEYRARLTNTAIRNNIGAVKGIADLHVHQLVNLAFGGRMYWGQHAGNKATALATEVINGTVGIAVGDLTAEEVIASVTAPGVDANSILWTVSPKRSNQQGFGGTDEGFFQLGGGGYPNYERWPHHADRSHQQVHISWLKEAHERHRDKGSNLNLLVVSVVNNDILCSALKLIDPWGNVPIWDSQGKIAGWESANWGCSDHDNVLRQLKAIHQLENDYSWYRVAMTPWHARQIIADGDLAVVISLETDKPLSGAGGNYGNWLEQLDIYRAMGVTTTQIVHESNSKFCGAAPHRNMMTALQAIHWPLQSFVNLLTPSLGPFPNITTFNLDNERYNKLGLTPDGEDLVDGLVKRNMPIDLAHGSQRCRRGIMSRVPPGYGLYDSHTKFKRLLEPAPDDQRDYGTSVLKREQEFLIMESILPDYVEHKVLVGLRTASVDVYDAPTKARVPNNCPGSANSFAQLILYANEKGLEFAYGTDFNTGVSQLGPRFNGLGREGACWADLVDRRDKAEKRPVKKEKNNLPPEASQINEIDGTNYYVDGLATIGWLPELTQDLIKLTPVAEKLQQSAEAYLKMWERAYTAVPVTGPEPGSLVLGRTCTGNDQCESGQCSSILGTEGVCVCNEDPDCGTGEFCNMGLGLNTCQALKANNESCPLVDGGNTCQSGYCSFGRCYEPNSVPMSGTCYVDNACQQGKCSSVDGTKGTCVCKEDRECGAGFWCDVGWDTNQNSCKRKLDKGEICGTVGDIDVGHRCKSGSCKVSGFSTKLTCQ